MGEAENIFLKQMAFLMTVKVALWVALFYEQTQYYLLDKIQFREWDHWVCHLWIRKETKNFHFESLSKFQFFVFAFVMEVHFHFTDSVLTHVVNAAVILIRIIWTWLVNQRFRCQYLSQLFVKWVNRVRRNGIFIKSLNSVEIQLFKLIIPKLAVTNSK